MRKLFTLLTCILLSALVFSQNKIGKVSGIITDESQKPLQSATVSLLRARDSSLVKIAVTDKEGKYELLEYSGRTPAQLKGNELKLTEINLTKKKVTKSKIIQNTNFAERKNLINEQIEELKRRGAM